MAPRDSAPRMLHPCSWYWWTQAFSQIMRGCCICGRSCRHVEQPTGNATNSAPATWALSYPIISSIFQLPDNRSRVCLVELSKGITRPSLRTGSLKAQRYRSMTPGARANCSTKDSGYTPRDHQNYYLQNLVLAQEKDSELGGD